MVVSNTAPAYGAEHNGTGLLEEAPRVSIVLPTREEAGNVAVVAARLEQILPGEAIEVIFVDDSDDATPQAIRDIRSLRPVRLIHREGPERTGGLGGAVVAGIEAARGEWVCVMDADLQHPPEVIEEMLEHAEATAAQAVVASRFCEGGGAGAFRRVRKAISRISSRAALMLFPSLRHVTDPMSGFFMVRRDAVDVEALHPNGFKILLEILVRTPGLRVTEVPYEFGKRHAGKTKASVREGFRYLQQLGQLEVGRMIARFGRFGVVGITGLIVNTAMLALLAGPFGVNYIVAAILATQASTLWNFCLTELWVFSDRQHRRTWSQRISMFFLMNNAALPLRIPILFVLTSLIGVNLLIANILSLAALTLLRFGIADSLIWGKSQARELKVRSYDIHGIVTVTSDTRLPELERFAVDELIAAPTIRVRIGEASAVAGKRKASSSLPAMANGFMAGSSNGAANGTLNGVHNGASNGSHNGDANGAGNGEANGVLNGDANGAGNGEANGVLNGEANGALNGHANGASNGITTNGHSRTLRYIEGRRGLGFGIAIEQRDDHIDVLATPLLERSPHVLYTNVVEPILRWVFASKGYALVHGAVFANDGEAVMVTARTDTGKTTTTLKLLDRYPYSFLSDDLSILCADGRVLAYPKPLTISRHTLHAVNAPLLSRPERVALVVQSRIHSRSGRRFAMMIAKLRIPAATVNAIVQRIIPPPKYHIDRLIPTARTAPEAQLCRLVVIERDHDTESPLTPEEAIETLMENCEDAFGFPPYDRIEGFLHGLNGTDLKLAERAIVESALSHVTASVLGSSTMDWWQKLPAVGVNAIEA